jgi:Mitochondrial carrier protein
MVKISQAEGISGLYAGMTGCLIGVASTNFAYFYWYNLVRGLWIARFPGQPTTAAELSLGAIAGALAQLFTIPVAVITTRQQTVPKNERKGLFGTAMEVIEGEDGWTGLWRGLKASLVLVVNPSITYGAYQRLRVVLLPNKAVLGAADSFRTCFIITACLKLTTISSWRTFQSLCNACHATSDRR